MDDGLEAILNEMRTRLPIGPIFFSLAQGILIKKNPANLKFSFKILNGHMKRIFILVLNSFNNLSE